MEMENVKNTTPRPKNRNSRMATARVNILNKMYIIVYTADFRTTSCKDLRNVYKHHEHGVNNKCFSFSTFPFLVRMIIFKKPCHFLTDNSLLKDLTERLTEKQSVYRFDETNS